MDFASALEQSAKMRAKAFAIERALTQDPENKGLRLTLLSAVQRAERAEHALLDLAESAQIDLCRYRVIKQTSNEYPAAQLAQSIVNYQGLFTAVYDFAKSGARATANYAKGVRDRTALTLHTRFLGQLGWCCQFQQNEICLGKGSLIRWFALCSELPKSTPRLT